MAVRYFDGIGIPRVLDSAVLNGTDMVALTQFGVRDGSIATAQAAGNRIELEVNTRLVSTVLLSRCAANGIKLRGRAVQVLHRFVSSLVSDASA